MKKGISTWICLLALTACQQAGRPAGTDITGAAGKEENDLRRQVRVGKWIYTIQYKPAEYILAHEWNPDDSAGLAQRREQLSGMAWFNISFGVEDFPQSPLRYELSGMDEYNARLHYFLNEAAGDIYLLYGLDTLRVAGYGFDNNQNLTPRETMVAGFALPDGDKAPVRDMQIAFYDRVFRNGIIKAIFRTGASPLSHSGNPVLKNH